MSEIKLFCYDPGFGSDLDEYFFFQWVKNISVIEKYTLDDNGIYLYIKHQNIQQNDLIEVIALFYRYNIKDMKQLQIFLTKENKKWFKNTYAYWYKKIFGMKPKKVKSESRDKNNTK